MRLVFSNKTDSKRVSWLKKKARVRKKVLGTAERPRLSVFRSNKHLYAQIVNDEIGATIVSTSTLAFDNSNLNQETAKRVGVEIARLAKDKHIENVIFDRNGFLYHGRIKALADGAREAGLKF